MSDWHPITFDELTNMLTGMEKHLPSAKSKFFNLIRVKPEKWKLSPWGNQGNGFWVIGVIGNQVLWYNDIEEGFNVSPYCEFGIIGKYTADQRNLGEALTLLQHSLE